MKKPEKFYLKLKYFKEYKSKKKCPTALRHNVLATKLCLLYFILRCPKTKTLLLWCWWIWLLRVYLQALDSGASDYLTKPFRTGELLARIRSAIKRNTNAEQSSEISVNELCIDMAAHTLKKNGAIVKLTSTEFSLLALFAQNRGRVLTHQYILKEIWGVGQQSETQYLRVFVAQLRKKIEDNPNKPTYIITESGVGYRFSD